MRRIISIILLSLLLIGCKKNVTSSTPTIIGNWIVLSSENVWTEYGETEYYTENFDQNNLTLTPIIKISEDHLDICQNNPCSIDYDCYAAFITTTSSEIIIQDGDQITYHLDGQSLVLISEYEDNDDGDYYYYKNTITLKRYDGDFPPDDWTSITSANDNYEPDNSVQSATNITTNGAPQEHILLCGEEDWYEFPADSGTTYTIETSSDLDTYLKLYDSSGNYLDEDDDNGNDSNAKIHFYADVNGLYYFVVHAFEYDDWETGPYDITVRTGLHKGATIGIIEKKSKKKKTGLKYKNLFYNE